MSEELLLIFIIVCAVGTVYYAAIVISQIIRGIIKAFKETKK